MQDKIYMVVVNLGGVTPVITCTKANGWFDKTGNFTPTVWKPTCKQSDKIHLNYKIENYQHFASYEKKEAQIFQKGAVAAMDLIKQIAST